MTTHPTTTHEHKAAHPHAETPPQTTDAIATAAHALVVATDRLGPRIAEHGYGCAAQHDGGYCYCGTTDFLTAMDALKAALLALPGKPTH